VHDLGHDQEHGEWFIVMELVEGHGLSSVLHQRGTLRQDEVVLLGFELADALAYAHSRGVIHRDVKPSNVLVQTDGSAKLVDFGLAAIEGWDVTLSGRVFGSPSYMAPERIQGRPGGPAADQFSLGVVLYESVIGKNPFDATTPEARLHSVLHDHPPPLEQERPGVEHALSETIGRLMAKNESVRFATMDDAAASFLRVGHELGLDPRRHLVRPDG
jgi:serine/threonine protein kinase